MIGKHESSDRALAELVAQLGRIAYGEGFVDGLTPAQWTALRYYARANRFSRTVSAFAEFHATSRGTASQTVKSLVNQGYLTRTRSERDGRSARLDVTEKGKAALADDPLEILVGAAQALSPTARMSLESALERMVRYVARERGRCPFGMCPSCLHLRGDGSCVKGRPPYECGFLDEPLEEAELDRVCVNFEPGRNSPMKRTFAEERPQ
jgi:DNA-binding MarR family transcriptional regulator